MQPAKETFSIGQVASILGLSSETLRRYDRAGKIEVRRTTGGKRFFTEEDIESIKNYLKHKLPMPHKNNYPQNYTSRKFPILVTSLVLLILALLGISGFFFLHTPYSTELTTKAQDALNSAKDKASGLLVNLVEEGVKNKVSVGEQVLLAEIPQDLSINSLTLSDDLRVGGDTSIEGTLTVSSESNLYSLNVNNNLNVTGDSLLTGSLNVGGTINGSTLSSTALTFTGTSASIYPSSSDTSLFLNGGTTGTVNIGNSSTGDIHIGGGTQSSGCTITNNNGSLNCSSDITSSGNLRVNGGTLSTTQTTLSIDVADSGSINFRDSSNTLVSITDEGTTGNINVTGIYKIGGTTGKTIATCGSSQYLGGIAITGGIVTTLGNCTTVSSSSSWSGLTNPTANLSLTMAGYTSTFTYNGATGAGTNLFTLKDTSSNTGTGYLLNLETQSSSTLKPLRVSAAGTEALFVDSNARVGIGTLSPDGLLHISGNDTNTNQLRVTNTAETQGGFLNLGNITTASTDGITLGALSTTGDIYFRTNGTNRILINENGEFLPSSSPTAGASSQTITTVDSTGNVGRDTGVAIGTDGFPVIVYEGPSNTVKVTKCGNAACSSGNTTTVVNTLGSTPTYHSSITIGTDGFPVIAYAETATTGDLYVTKCGNAACSSGNTTTVVNSGGGPGYTSIAIGADGFPVVSHGIGQADGCATSTVCVGVVKCGNAACSSGNTLNKLYTQTTNVGYSTSIAVGTDGLPVVSNIDATNGLTISKCGNAACSSGNTTTVVDGTIGNSAGSRTSTVIGTDGLPVVSYYDATNSAIKVIKCGNSGCTTGNTTTTIESQNTAGNQSAIKIGADGLPILIWHYWDGQNHLKVGKCGNVSCSAFTTITVIDTTAVGSDSGSYPGIAIAPDGLPFVSYYSGINQDLKVAKCADPACKNTSGGSFAGGTSIGSTGSFFNNVYAAQFWGRQFQIAAFDLAEEYEVSDTTIEAGDVVKLGIGSATTVGKTDKGYETSILGVVSTKPAITLGDWPTQNRDNLRPIALKGRVPVKVTNENGSIKRGDFLTSSSTPGYAMKATNKGIVIGIALEDQSQDQGKIEVFVNLHYNDPGVYLTEKGELEIGTIKVASTQNTQTSETQIATASATTSQAPAPQEAQILVSTVNSILSRLDSLEKLLSLTQSASNSGILDNLTITNKLSAGDLGITGKISSGLLAINGLDDSITSASVTINTLSGDLYLQNQGLGGINILNGKITIDKDGNLNVQNVLTVKKVNINQVDNGYKSAGSILIKTGETQVQVQTSALTPQSLIFAASDFPVAVGAVRKDDTALTIMIKEPQNQDLKVSWWIVN